MTPATAAVALERAAARGLQIIVEAGELVVLADRDLEPAEWDRLLQLKPDLLRELTAIRLDFETVSPLDLKEVGAAVYAADEPTDVFCLCWCIGQDPVQVWQPGEPPPAELLDALIGSAGPVVCHGSFDRLIWQEKLVPAGWPVIPLERWSDTLARARAYRIPAGLEKGAERLELRHRKDKTGKVLNRRAQIAARGGKPLSDTENAAFLAYCKTDVEVLRELDQRLPELTGTDRQVFDLDAKMNDRGLPIDLDLVRKLSAVHDAENERLTLRIAELTNGEVTSLDQRARLLSWLNTRHAGLANSQRETLDAWLQDDLFGDSVAEAVQLRQEYAHSAGAKLKKLLASTSADGRARGCFAWHGAHTGRWAGRGCQPQNFPRTGALEDVEATLAALLHHGGPIDSDNGMSVKARISACLRATIAAQPGYELVVGDLAQIESSVLCWLAGQQNMLDVYRRDGDPYVETAASLGSTDRQFGKLLTLAAGYGGGAGMLLGKAPSYGLTLTLEDAAAAIAGWRAANPDIEQFWYALHDEMIAVVEAPLGPGRRGRHLALFRRDDDTLRIKLPSGRELIFHRPRMEPNPDRHDDRLQLNQSAPTGSGSGRGTAAPPRTWSKASPTTCWRTRCCAWTPPVSTSSARFTTR